MALLVLSGTRDSCKDLIVNAEAHRCLNFPELDSSNNRIHQYKYNNMVLNCIARKRRYINLYQKISKNAARQRNYNICTEAGCLSMLLCAVSPNLQQIVIPWYVNCKWYVIMRWIWCSDRPRAHVRLRATEKSTWLWINTTVPCDTLGMLGCNT